jgi:putative tricarboxylic transport membrane protein
MGEKVDEKMKRYADAISGSIVVLIGVVMFFETRNIQALMVMDFGPKIMPRIFTIGLVLFGSIVAVGGYLRAMRDPSVVQSSRLGSVDLKKVVFTIGLIIAYVVALRPLGFLVTSVLYLFFQILVLGGAAKKRRLLPYAVVSLIMSFGIYFLFTDVFTVFLPKGRIW